MESFTPRIKTVVTSVAVCVLCTGLVLFGAGCPTTPQCTADADCDDGAYCNGAETCVNSACQAGTNPCATGQTCDEATDACVTEGCQTDEDCAEGEFCDTETNECVANDLYVTTKVDADYPERVHFGPSGHTSCTVCHHAADDAAGVPDAAGQSCKTCHSESPDEPNSFKSVAHDENESGDGCRMCHDAEFTTGNCGFCHPLVED